MKLLAPNVGWAFGGRLLWTSNGGTEWEDVTPADAKDGLISAVFFLDTNQGWVMLAHGEPDIPGGLQFDLASTDNAGATWSVEPLRMPDWLAGSLFNGGGWLAFADPNHGWLALGTGLTAASQGGAVLVTSDGGKSWEYTDTPDSVAGPMVMVTPQFGWLVGGGAGNDELLVTRDGAKTWQTVELESPVKTDLMRKYDRNAEQFEQSFYQKLPPAAAKFAGKEPQHRFYDAYSLPTFEDTKHGYVCVTYPGVVVLFATEDGGVSWKPDRVLTGLHEHQMGAVVVSAVADSTWITGRVPRHGGVPQLTKLGPGASVTDTTMPAPEESGVSQMSFATASRGWVVAGGKLMATNDGGATWTDITP